MHSRGIRCIALVAACGCSDPDAGTLIQSNQGAGGQQSVGGQSEVGGASSGAGASSSGATAGGAAGTVGNAGAGTGGTSSSGMTGTGGADAGAGRAAGGSAGNGNSDPLASGGPSKCPLGGNLLCDGFEGAAPGQPDSPFKVEVGSGSSAVVDATKVFRGSKAVHMKTEGGQAFITETVSFKGTTAAANNELWGRVWIWFETDAAPNSHDVFIRLEDPDSDLSSAQFHVAGGSRGQLAAEIRSGSDLYRPKIIDPRPATPPPGVVMFPLEPPRWQCWEWHTTANNTLDFYIDGQLYEKMSVKAEDHWPLPVFKKLYLGFMQYGSTPATELWLDEVALSSQRVGCGN